MNDDIKIIQYDLAIEGWHRLANVVLDIDGCCTCVTAQCNNPLQKVLVLYDE